MSTMLARFTAPAVLAVSLLGCSDPAPAPAQGAIVFTMSNSPTCTTAQGRVYSLPSGPDAVNAIRTSAGEDRATGESYRVVDGDPDIDVSCTVSKVDDTTFRVEGSLRKAGSVRFSVRGTVNASGGDVTVSEWDNLNGLVGPVTGECTLDLTDKYLSEGAIWASVTCPSLKENLNDCRGSGTFIFENCDR
jgi:hypothetical protein